MPVLDEDLTKQGMRPGAGAFRKEYKQLETKWVNALMESEGLSRGQAQHMVQDFARLPVDGKGLNLTQIADKWDMAEERVRKIHGQMKGDYGHFRKSTASMSLLCASLLNTEIVNRLLDPEELKRIPTEKMSKMAKELGDLAVVLQDGHLPSVNINMADPAAMKSVTESLAAVKEITSRRK